MSALLVAAVWLVTGAGPAPSLSGHFKPAGELKTARKNHTATLLNDGRVLVVGGQGVDVLEELKSVELFDVKSGKWKPGPPLVTGRSGHTATLLNDGRVLVAGGTTHDKTSGDERFLALASVEIYDPKTNSWAMAPPMHDARHWHTATLLDDGRVLVAGGARENKSFLSVAELYEPESNAWVAAAPMAVARCSAGAVKLKDGTVVVAGGRDMKALGSAERFDPSNGKWSKLPELNDPHQQHAVMLLQDGRVMVIGGAANTGLTNLCELWAVGQTKWTLADHSLSMAHQEFATVLLKNGDVFVTGGEPYDSVDTAMAQRFDVTQQLWCRAGNLAVSRKHHTATTLPDGRVLVVGGTSSGVVEPSAELWEESKGRCVEPPGLTLSGP